MLPKIPGCIFHYNGSIPESAYTTDLFESPIEKAVYDGNNPILLELIKEGSEIVAHLKIGEMSCFEYASLKGYHNILFTLLEHSSAKEIIQEYFKLEDIADRANMMSKNKEAFFGKLAVMMEINRYIASMYTAILFNQPECLRVLLRVLGKRDLFEERLSLDERRTTVLNAMNLAQHLGHQKCFDMLQAHCEK